MSDLPRNQMLVGDAVGTMRHLPPASVDCVIFSPPYFLLRNYGGGRSELGTEDTVEDYADRLGAVMVEVARVLKPTGSAWVNLGDTYSRGPRYGAEAKSLLMVPARFGLRMVTDGWIIRNIVVWHKPNAMPSSVTDRLSASWEHLYLLTRQRDAYFDLDAIREPHRSKPTIARRLPRGKYTGPRPWAGPLASGDNAGLGQAKLDGRAGHPLGRNPRDVWTIPAGGYRGAHWATYPTRLLERPIKATCPERTCISCGRPWRRESRRDRLGDLTPGCQCRAGHQPGIVLDPFMGSGTTAIVAQQLGRDWLGIELNRDYADGAADRLRNAA